MRYGVKVFRDCTAGELVNPAKSSKEIESETLKGLDLYIKSHSAYRVGVYFCATWIFQSLLVHKGLVTILWGGT